MDCRLALLALLVAGCLDEPVALPQAPPAPAGPPQTHELLDVSFRFQDGDGAPFAESFQASGAGTLHFILDALEDCPVTRGNDRPGVVVRGPDNTTEELLVNPGSFTSLCPPQQGTQPRRAAQVAVCVPLVPGPWELRSHGNYSAAVRVRVLAQPCDGRGATAS